MSQILELQNHPFYVGVQFHPEYKSRPGKPSALFLGMRSLLWRFMISFVVPLIRSVFFYLGLIIFYDTFVFETESILPLQVLY